MSQKDGIPQLAGVGALAGLMGGLVFGIVLFYLMAPLTGGELQQPVIAAAQLADPPNPLLGWSIHLLGCALGGAVFGILFGNRIRSFDAGLAFGTGYGLALWGIVGLILLPLLTSHPVFSPLTHAAFRSAAFSSLIGYLTYGLLTGELFFEIAHRWRKSKAEQEFPQEERRAA